MTGHRVAEGGLIDRSKPLNFSFDGQSFTGHPGDTLASALLANGVRIMGRSFKYHRPRGVWSAWFDDPNATFNIELNGNHLPNCPATTTYLQDGMIAKTVNAFPSAKHDIKGLLNHFSRFMPAGFYYKTFMWPDWHLFEPAIRKMAGLGALEHSEIEGFCSDQQHDRCELLVVGAGAAGLVAARTAAEAGVSVLLIDDHPEAGGGLYGCADEIDGVATQNWIGSQIAAIEQAGGRVLLNATAFGIYDHGLVSVIQQRGFALAPTLFRIRCKRVIMATGAIDRPVTFADNDRPGVLSLAGAQEFLGRYGVLVGQKIAVLANHSLSTKAIEKLSNAGANLEVYDPTKGECKALGGKRLSGLSFAGTKIPCDTLLTSNGLTPLVHLWSYAGGKLDWDESRAAFVPGTPPTRMNMSAVGAANGTFDLEEALHEARAVALNKPAPDKQCSYSVTAHKPTPGSSGHQWIDFQHDVTLKDIELAARENYISVEHLKRYTTLGMASDQGKTSNVSGLAAMAALRAKPVPEVGTTTFRPPFVPIPLELYRGHHRQQQFHPIKRLPLEAGHRAAGAALGEYGGWLRPGWYGKDSAKLTHEIIADEVLMARNAAAIFDASPLGKIEVMGPDAKDFVNFIYYNTLATLKPGHIRYGFMLTESGIVHDDGVISCIDENRYIISCSSSHVAGVNALLEAWRQDGHNPNRIFVHDTTQHWPTLTVSGPKAREVLEQLDLGVDLSGTAFPHMTFRTGQFQGTPARIACVSFTGDLSYEVSVPTDHIHALWQAMLAAGEPLGAKPMGVEALSVLRAEKGYLIIGKDTDGETMPHDLGFTAPRMEKKAAYIGDRGLHTQQANRSDRKRLVGIEVQSSEVLGKQAMIPTGAHFVTESDSGLRSCGYVTSSYHSPTLNRPIALGLLEAGVVTPGKQIEVFHLGKRRPVNIVAPCFFDPDGERLHA